MRQDIKVSLDCAECFIAKLQRITLISSGLKLLLMYEKRSVNGLIWLWHAMRWEHESSACLVTVHNLPANRLGFQDATNALPLQKVQGKTSIESCFLDWCTRYGQKTDQKETRNDAATSENNLCGTLWLKSLFSAINGSPKGQLGKRLIVFSKIQS